MKKKSIFAIIICMICIFVCACGSGSSTSQSNEQAKDNSNVQSEENNNVQSEENNNAQPEENLESAIIGQSYDLISCAEGNITFVGFQKADPELTNEENAYVFIFDFTNFRDEPSEVQDSFWIQFFQNGAELSDPGYYMSKAKEQYDLVSAFSNDVLKDGTVRFGEIVVTNDDSPVTVMAREQLTSNSGHYETIEVNLSDGTVIDN